MLYFVVARETGRTKIGLAANPFERLVTMQTSCWEELALLGYAECDEPRKAEREVHAMFADTHIRGEWFDWSDGIGDYVAGRLNRDFDALAHLRVGVKRNRNGRPKRKTLAPTGGSDE